MAGAEEPVAADAPAAAVVKAEAPAAAAAAAPTDAMSAPAAPAGAPKDEPAAPAGAPKEEPAAPAGAPKEEPSAPAAASKEEPSAPAEAPKEEATMDVTGLAEAKEETMDVTGLATAAPPATVAVAAPADAAAPTGAAKEEASAPAAVAKAEAAPAAAATSTAAGTTAPAAAAVPAAAPAAAPAPIPADTPIPDGLDLPAMRTQVEYYFSDANLPRDKFLKSKVDETVDGYVPLAVLVTFKKLMALNATPAALAAAVTPSTALVLDDTRALVRRATPLPPPDKIPDWRTRSVYVRGWKPNTIEPTVETVREAFSPYGTVTSVRVRRWMADDKKRHFRGSVFVEFDADEAADRVLAEDNHTIQVAVADTLVDTTKMAAEAPPAASAAAPNAGSTATDAPAGPEMETITLTVMSIDAHAKKKAAERAERVEKMKARAEARKGAARGGAEGGTAAAVPARELTPGMVVRLTGLPAMATREDLKEAFETFGKVAWVDYNKGDAAGHLRFDTPGAAAAAAAATPAPTVVGAVPALSLLTGDPEVAYWTEL